MKNERTSARVASGAATVLNKIRLGKYDSFRTHKGRKERHFIVPKRDMTIIESALASALTQKKDKK